MHLEELEEGGEGWHSRLDLGLGEKKEEGGKKGRRGRADQPTRKARSGRGVR